MTDLPTILVEQNDKDGSFNLINDDDGAWIGTMGFEETQYKEIAHRCNAYPELVKALESIINVARENTDSKFLLVNIRVKCLKALSKAKGETK